MQAFLDGWQRLLAARCAEADVRRVMETPEGFDRALWGEIAALGITGLIVAPEHGGVGGGATELERVMEAAGAALLPSPLLSSGVLAAGLLGALGDAEAAARLLPGIADGSRIATVALTGPRARWIEDDVAVTAAPAGNGWQLDGAAAFVTHAEVADLLLVVARAPDGLGVFEVDPAAVATNALPAFDRTLRMADLTFAGTPATRLAGAIPAWEAVEAALDLARVAIAGEQAGGTRRVFEMTVDYAKARHQFGRAIGGFQAIKHMAADLLLESESCTSAARHAAERLAAGAEDAPQAIALAAFACADAFVHTTAQAIQMHGGIAFTWAHPAHLYLRRARADAQLFGTSDAYRERFVQALEQAR
ncbi:acyl-CoA dehydrogenase [alpha proteobacterium AAP81b]|nr:acyl-CoA dehydrogenase [alpha proteobacterium AAP81b]